MSPPFDQLLETLAGRASDLPRADLAFLSDLDTTQLERFRKVWEGLEDARRAEILEELGRLAQNHIELNFDRIDRMSLDDPDGRVRRLAIENLWESEDPALVPALVRAVVEDPEGPVRAAAAATLGTFVYLGEADRLPSAALTRVEAALLRAADDPDEDVRLRVLETLGYSSRPEVPALIRRAYESESESRRRSALLAMARSADEVWAPEVLSELRSPSPTLRLEATKTAGELELQESVPDLIDLLEDGAPGIRRAAIWALGQVGGKRAADVLNRLLDSADEDDESGLLEDALDQLAFVNGTRDLTLLDLDDEVVEDEDSDEADADDEGAP
jgi:HEAT repeat protein